MSTPKSLGGPIVDAAPAGPRTEHYPVADHWPEFPNNNRSLGVTGTENTIVQGPSGLMPPGPDRSGPTPGNAPTSLGGPIIDQERLPPGKYK